MSDFPDWSQRPEQADACPRCGRAWQIGDWPFCGGNPQDHEAPHYTWTWGNAAGEPRG